MDQRNITYLSVMLFFLFGIACYNSQSLDSKNTFLNLDFETIKNDGSPKNWYTGGEGYKVEIDSLKFYSGKKSLRISKVTDGKFGVATSTFPVNEVKGKHITYSGWIKTENIITGNAGLWWRVDGKDGIIKIDNMSDRGAIGTAGWQEYKIDMDISEDAANINFGVLLSGDGTAWFDNLQIKIDEQVYEQSEPLPFVPTDEQLEIVKNNSIHFSSCDPNNNSNDLTKLKKIFKDADIISLGEGTHGTKEFFQMKHRIVKYAAEQNENIVFAIEANMPEALRVNDYILYGKGDAITALGGLYFWTWNTEEVLNMIEWMRSYNLSGKGKIEFWGFDMQYPKLAIENLKKFLNEADKTHADSLITFLDEVSNVFEKVIKISPQEKYLLADYWYNNAIKVFNYFQSNRSKYLQTYDTLFVDVQIQNARILVQGGESLFKNKQSRDESMAENVVWTKEHIAKDRKMVLWAHNEHVSKIKGRMGNYLAQKFGDEMIVFGFAFYSGQYTAAGKNGLGIYTTSLPEPGSIEWILNKTGIQNMIIDFKNVTNNPKSDWLTQSLDFRSIGAMAMDYAFRPAVITKEYDALIFIDKTTPSKLLPKETRSK
ncbi:MAG: hypothetical protein A2068_01630 [Ignavibacteria bacterium GWB2_35_6b]|nr:MAG: hypothetical protein A2068_01630 [Ignavibacteria bacterium GWB2_35_6b]